MSESDSQSFDTVQQIRGMSMCANVLFAMVGTQDSLQKSAESLMANYMGKYFGNWKRTWGPKVWKQKPNDGNKGADNVWFAATAPGIKYPDGTFDTCAVGIAATPEASDYALPVEDLYNDRVVNFNAWVDSWTNLDSIPAPNGIVAPRGSEGTPFISYGTALGVYQIMKNASPSPGGTRIHSYLSKLPSNTRVVFTGHSLGAALAPTLAMALVRRGVVKSKALVLPSGGASPGNKGFADAYSAAFPIPKPHNPVPWENFNSLFYNTLDIVPQAWSVDVHQDRNFGNILSNIYTKLPTGLRAGVWILVTKYSNVAKKCGVPYVSLPGLSFTGPPIPDNIHDRDSLTDEILKQHIYQYNEQYGVPSPVKAAYAYLVSIAEEEGIKKKTTKDVWIDFGLPLEGFDWIGDDKHPYDEVYGQ